MNEALQDSKALDELFRQAVARIDSGDAAGLEDLLRLEPILLSARLNEPGSWLRDKVGNAIDSFFAQPYLLWFVAEDPVRNGRLPPNIAEIAKLIIELAARADIDSLNEQLDYAIQLVCWSWIARECGVQIALLDVMLDAGASVRGSTENALVNGNIEAAEHLVNRGVPLTLASAACLGYWEIVESLGANATSDEKQFALVLCALRGKTDGIAKLLPLNVDVNQPSKTLYSHGTPLHHAVASGSLSCVKLLLSAGANPNVVDAVWQGTPLGWAEHFLTDPRTNQKFTDYPAIASLLRNQPPQP